MGGTGLDRRNLTPMYAMVSQSTLAKVEKAVEKRLDLNHTMYYEVMPHYSGNSPVPDGIGYFWKDITTGDSDGNVLPNTPSGT